MEAAASEKKESCLSSVVSEQDKKTLNNVKESNNNKAQKSQYPYSYFYGSDDGEEDTVYPDDDDDEEDTPKPRDAEERERMRLARGPPVYVSNKKAIEEARKLRAFNRTHGMLFPSKSWFENAMSPTLPPQEPLPLLPPPSPDFAQQLSSLSFGELVSLLEEELKQFHSSAPGLGRQTEVYS